MSRRELDDIVPNQFPRLHVFTVATMHHENKFHNFETRVASPLVVKLLS
jgi:hypothetical protein